MALIKLGPMVADARGSVGGTTFSRNSAGAYSRNRTKPVYPGSESQTTRAGQMATLVDAWQTTLTVAQREAWTAAAHTNHVTNRVGDRIVPSGLNLYIRANMALLITAQTAVATPPTAVTVDAPQVTIAWSDGNGVQVTSVHGWAPSYTDKVQIQRVGKIRQSINFWRGPWDGLVAAAGADFRGVPYQIYSDANLDSDTRAFFRFRVVVDDGGISQAWIQYADVGTIT